MAPRIFGFGYRVGDCVTPPACTDHGASIKTFQSFWTNEPRRPIQVALGLALPDLAPPAPDTHHGPTLLEGCKARFCRNPPKVSRATLRSLRSFTRMFVRRHFSAIPLDADTSVETWLKHCNSYTQSRKDELLKLWNERKGALGPGDLDCKLFTKTETYASFKHARGINSRSDMFKCYSGPYFKLMEDEVYKHKAFIKHVPVRQRPQYIMDMLGGFPGPFAETDYTSFEAHFVPELLRSVEFELYRHMLGNFPSVYRTIARCLAGTNKCISRWFALRVKGRRMSGEMCTSLGNGFTNLVLSEYVAWKNGGSVVGVVEGDDGLFHFSNPPTSLDYERLGFRIKMLWHDNLLRTSFCGMVMSRDFSTMTDPKKVLLNFGWTHSPLMNSGPRVRLGLLRAKALSLAYEHPKCPILSELAKKGLSVTSGVAPRFDTGWYEADLRSQLSQFALETKIMLEEGPSFWTRHDFADHFGISVQLQLLIEEDIRNCPGFYLNSRLIDQLFDAPHEPCRVYSERYLSAHRDKPPV